MFHVEQERRWIVPALFHVEHCTLSPGERCRMKLIVIGVPRGTPSIRSGATAALGERKMFHVEHRPKHVQHSGTSPSPARELPTKSLASSNDQLPWFQVDVPTVECLFLPTRIRRRREFGTGMGSCQSQVTIRRSSSRSRAPIQRSTRSTATRGSAAHSRNG